MYLKTSVLPQRYTSLFLVSNFADMIGTMNDYRRMEDMLRGRVNELLPGQKVWMLSALDELCRQSGSERPNSHLADVLEAGFDQFRSEVLQLIKNKRDTVLPDRMQRMLRIMAAEIGDDLSALERGLEMDSQDVMKEAERVKSQKQQQIQTHEDNSKRIDDIIRGMQGEAAGWIEQILNRMKKEAGALEAYSEEDLLKYYPFFCIDTMQEALNRCVDYHRDKLCEALDAISVELTQALTKSHVQTQYSFRFALDNKTWTKGDNVGFAVSMSGMGILSLIADGIGGVMRKAELKNRRPQVVQEIRQQYDALFVSVQKAVSDTYHRMGGQAKKCMDEFYADKLRSLEQQTAQSAAAFFEPHFIWGARQ